MSTYFENIPIIKYEGNDSKNPLSFKYYNPEQVVLGKKMKEHLPFALGLLNAAKLIEDGRLDTFIKERYESFESELGKKVRAGKTTLQELSKIAEELGNTEKYDSGRQENLRSIINSVIF